MNWDAARAIGEILGAVAVVISLAYLAIQIRAQNTESKLASVHEISEGYRNLVAEMINPSLAKVWVKFLSGYDELNDEEKMQVIAFGLVTFKLFEEAYYQFKAARLDSYIWEGMVAQLSNILGSDGISTVWKSRKYQLSSEFVQYIDQLKTEKYEM